MTAITHSEPQSCNMYRQYKDNKSQPQFISEREAFCFYQNKIIGLHAEIMSLFVSIFQLKWFSILSLQVCSLLAC